jgi:hypothetical protein
VGKASRVGVADGGNQTIVWVGGGASVGRGVSVGGIESNGRQAIRMGSPNKRKKMRESLIRE